MDQTKISIENQGGSEENGRWKLLTYQLSQKLKQLENDDFNH